jgi:GH35 family endo-1,4-beta-xylanase
MNHHALRGQGLFRKVGSALLVLLTVLSGVSRAADAAAGDGTDWQTEANARIAQHRKGDLRLTVTRGGKSVSGAQVTVRMQRHEFLFGCNIFRWEACATPEENAAYSRRFSELFNFATLPFYWWSYEPRKDDTADARARNERIAAWCAQNGIRTKGHPLAWNFHELPWSGAVDADELRRRQLQRITDCVAHFSGKVGVWDVINEAAEWGRSDCRRQAPQLTALIEKEGVVEHVKACFAAARKGIAAGAPAPLLLINDYQTKQSFVRLLEQLTDENGKPLYDAIGIQSHMHGTPWSNAELWNVCERFARFGKPIHFTEMTVLSTRQKFNWTKREMTGTAGTVEEDEARQRDTVVRLYTMLFSHPTVEAVTWWDLSDNGAWMNLPAGLLRADMSPKPAYLALKKLIREDWTTNTTVATDGTGTAHLRAFRGEYRFTVRLPDGTDAGREFSGVVKKGDNAIELSVP